VIWNLLSNAIKFTPKDGHIKVHLTRDESHVMIVISDNGQGISADFLPHVFDRFRQAEASTTRKFGGLGLGLAIARHLVELHGGLISVESAGTGQGSTFTVRLPIMPLRLTSAEEQQTSGTNVWGAPADVEPLLKGLIIVVVDDEEDARQLLTQMLTSYGATVKSAESSAQAFSLIQQHPPDLLVSDIGMPGEDGYSLIRKVREYEQGRDAKLPAVALTAFARPRDRMQALAAGFHYHVPKPVEPSELVTVIASLTGRLGSDGGL
jgi:CheY-like chemotaxis protein